MNHQSQKSGLPVHSIAILDLDGTLLQTSHIDNVCYWRAVARVYPALQSLPDLHSFCDVTDGGILQEWVQSTLGRPPTELETSHVKEEIVRELSAAWDQDPGAFARTPGVRSWLETVAGQPGHVAIIATGCWRCSAEFKLAVSGLDQHDIPLISGDDASTRTGLLQLARAAVLDQFPANSDPHITCYGDAPWDYRAAREMNWNFVGIAGSTGRQALLEAGAETIWENFFQPSR